MTKEVKFKNTSFAQRIKGMLGVDFYRLFHTPMFYIFLGIAAIIPALVSMGGGEGASIYTTAWQIIAASEPLYAVSYTHLSSPLPTKFVKCDGNEQANNAIKA